MYIQECYESIILPYVYTVSYYDWSYKVSLLMAIASLKGINISRWKDNLGLKQNIPKRMTCENEISKTAGHNLMKF